MYASTSMVYRQAAATLIPWNEHVYDPKDEGGRTPLRTWGKTKATQNKCIINETHGPDTPLGLVEAKFLAECFVLLGACPGRCWETGSLV